MNFITKLTAATALAAATTLAAGCAGADDTGTAKTDGKAEVGGVEKVDSTGGVKLTNAAYRADFRSEPNEIKAGEPAALVFTVKDAQGNTVRDLPIVHEKPMHLLVTSSDLNEFYHIHPEPQADGTLRVEHTFPAGGDYKLYADYTPEGGKQIVDRIPFKVAGNTRPAVRLKEDSSNTKTVDGLRVTMGSDKPLRAGEDLMLNFAVADERTKKPVTDLQPYLGALAHFVIISEDGQEFLHAHPMEKTEMTDGHGGMNHDMKHDAKPHAHGANAKHDDHAAPNASASEVSAHTSFPKAGLYKVWAQFQRNNRVATVPFVVRVSEGEAIASNMQQNTQVPADAIKVTVSGAGYEPSRIEVKKGQPVKLAFNRKDAENCGGEVMFPKLNVRKKLPVGQTVVVEITPQETGELAFTCGMSMYKGALVVQ